ncbi:tRNA N6-adenosine threonylcarbamoyltransferase, mitochondrial [Eucyclogobius newberryi]|uniref:tRNA N6-adenosine threonylcarbamoyltransferase, mitochondrial n=1 Tax=Eucyclogobius newberryi TaxID=166745 RepID=UPI003B5CA505
MFRRTFRRVGALGRGCVCRQSRAEASSLVLGIETSCDDTGAAVLDLNGTVLGESLHSQKEVHLRTGGIIPTVARQLHSEHIERVVNEALALGGVAPRQLAAVATTVKPGLALSLGIGLDFSLRFVRAHRKPFIPIHHMEAHALTARMTERLDFPFLVLLISGGHALVAVARGVDDFLLLGHSLDEAPGDTLDKIARRLSLPKHPLCSSLSGGQAMEVLARTGDRARFKFTTPMGQTLDCNFSFAGLRNQVSMAIQKQEQEEGVAPGTLLSCVNDLAASAQHTVAAHLAKRTHRAVLFCKHNRLLPEENPALVLSGGVASNGYVRKALSLITEREGLRLLCPPPQLCTDNGVMVAWNGVERLREKKGILSPDENVRYEPKAPLGVDFTAQVRAAAIKVPPVKMTIT